MHTQATSIESSDGPLFKRQRLVLRTLVGIVCVTLGPATNCALGQSILYVDDDAPPGGDGTTWSTAFGCIQTALTAAQPDDEIRVAQGTYRPDEDTANPNGTGDRTSAFSLVDGISLYGGYAGLGAPEPDVRDPQVYLTILSGDLNEDDAPNFLNTSENSHHVMMGAGIGSTAVVDGLVITQGGAQLINCLFSGNIDRRRAT